MYSRHARRKTVALTLYPTLLVAVALVLLTLAFSAQSAHAASGGAHVDVMTPVAQVAVMSSRTTMGASSLNNLLSQVNGRTVILNSGQVTLNTSGDSLQTINASSSVTFYSLLLDPNVIFLLFIVAMIGLFVEISHPGMILPGVVGAIALILFLFGAGSISPNWAGLALMALAFVLLVLDIKLTTHGVLTVGAIASLIFGALIFFNSGGPYQGPQVNTALVFGMAGFVGLLGLYVVLIVMRTRRQRVMTGTEGMIGAMAFATTPLMPDGWVDYQGEQWAAVLDDPEMSLDPGSEVRIVSVEGLHLHVAPAFNRFINSTSSLTQG